MVDLSTPPHCRGYWAVVLLQYPDTLQGAVGSGYPAVDFHTAGGRGQSVSFDAPPHGKEPWVVCLPQCTAALYGAASSGGGGGSKARLDMHCQTCMEPG